MASEVNTLAQLRSARDLALRKPALYPQVVPGIIGVISSHAPLGLRRWGADFLAETFASQVVTAEDKQQMSLVVLDTLRGYLSRKELVGEDEDSSVVKSAVQCAASVYPFVFRHTATTPTDSETWSKMAGIKSSILRRMDTASAGVRICCIKFVASVVLTQTPGLIADPRRPQLNEISLAIVPREHPMIPPANLEAEASGLLDRLLGVLQDNLSDALVVTATLNSLASLVQRRASVSTKIITTVLAFNPLKVTSRPISGKDKVTIRSMTRTTMSFLLNFLKRNTTSPMAGRIQQHVERLKHGLTEVFTELPTLKRPAPDEPTDGLSLPKRVRVEEQAMNGTSPLQQPPPQYYPLPSGPISLAQLFTLTNDPATAQFHAQRLQPAIITQLIPALVQALPQARIDEAVNIVRGRWFELSKRPPPSAMTAAKAALGEEEDDDDYDPLTAFGGEANRALSAPSHGPSNGLGSELAIGPFRLPTPPPLTAEDLEEYSKIALTRVFGTLADLDHELRLKGKPAAQPEKGFNRLAMGASATGFDREGWITLLIRLATRAPFGLDVPSGGVKPENGDRTIAKRPQAPNLTRNIRESLFNYVMENFRARIDVAIMWLNEEWYAGRVLQKQKGREDDLDALQLYWQYTLRILDAMATYIDVKDGRLLIRFLSEVPVINRDVLKRVRDVAVDPELVPVCANALLYLIMFKPPAREMAIDCVQAMFEENEDAKTATRKILTKWRPAVLEEATKAEVKAEKA